MQLALTALILTIGAAPSTATEALKSRDSEIRANIPADGKPVTPPLKKKLEVILTHAVDLEAMAKASLRSRWEEQPKAKQKEFLDVFVHAFRNAISGQIDLYRSSSTEFGAEKMLDQAVEVPTKLIVKGEPTDVIYTMKQQGADWRIVDITVDGVSTVENYRASFAKVIKQKGFDGLITQLKKKVDGEKTQG
jgi:phospholipid transport system substrate-binding protein